MVRKKLNLGCGHDKKTGYINCDISPEVNPDKVIDLEKAKLPFKDNEIDEVLAEHVFEHIRNFTGLMHELRRVCKNNAKIKIRVPFYNSCEQFTDPTHVRFFTPFTFDYFDNTKIISKYSHEVKSEGRLFLVEKVKINYSLGRAGILNSIFNPLINMNHRIYCKFFAGFFPSSEIIFDIRVLK